MSIDRKTMKVLIVDDDRTLRILLQMQLEEDNYEVMEAENGLEALQILADDSDVRLMITDLSMPKMDGFELINSVRQQQSRYIYIIVLTSTEDRKSLIKALSLGADDYLVKPVLPDELKLRLTGGTRLLNLESQEALLFSMSKLSEYRSQETGYHLERSYHYTRLLARDIAKSHPELKLSLSMADTIARVSPLHDIGKVSIPDNILHKPGKLTTEEFEVMKTHALIGGNLIKEIYDRVGSLYLWYAYEVAMFHHEKWNGKGYPQGLSGTKIPIAARIMALADVYDALTSHRCYKTAAPHEKAKSIILEEKGNHFDPMIIESFEKLEDEWLSIKEKFPDS